jgi:aminopeptidase-like protein
MKKKDLDTQEFNLLDRVFDDLFPICRSITGLGIEQSLEYFKQYMPLNIDRVKSGTQVFDWQVPPSWIFHRAQLWDPNGQLVCDTDINNLHVVNYSEPVDGEFELENLQHHLHSLAHLPDAIPYVTSYYKKTWGFCLSHNQRAALKPGKYKVLIQSKFDDQGGVPFGQCTLEGNSKKEILLTSYLCHPSMANNELSGPLVLLGLYNRIKNWPKQRFSYRFLLNPETIGSLCFLYKNYDKLHANLEAGLILTCLGGPTPHLTYKASKRTNTLFDKVINSELRDSWKCIPFSPLSGSDERQYCAPGFNLPMGQLSKTTYGQYDGYHNSLDNKEFMGIENIITSIDEIESMLLTAEYAGKVINLCPYGEPQLGKRGLYPNMNSFSASKKSNDNTLDGREELNALLTILSEADGEQYMIDIAKKTGLELGKLVNLLDKLESAELIKFNSGETL